MNVKAQGLLNAALYIEEMFGAETLGLILAACSAPVRQTLETKSASDWHPATELCEFVSVAERKVPGQPRLAEDIGAAAARANLRGLLLRVALFWGSPESVMKRIAGMWPRYNDEGTMEIVGTGTEDATIEVKGIVHPNATLCRILTGWYAEVAIGLGGTAVAVRHRECRALGSTRCVWTAHGSAP